MSSLDTECAILKRAIPSIPADPNNTACCGLVAKFMTCENGHITVVSYVWPHVWNTPGLPVLKGGMPDELGSLRNLKVMHFFGNELKGSIPDSYKNLKNLEDFNMFSNQLTGSIPSWIGEWESLWAFNIQRNFFTGSIPDSVGDLRKLKVLHIKENQLSGKIPDSIKALPELKNIILEINRFRGPFPLMNIPADQIETIFILSKFSGLRTLQENCFTDADIPAVYKARVATSNGKFNFTAQRDDCPPLPTIPPPPVTSTQERAISPSSQATESTSSTTLSSSTLALTTFMPFTLEPSEPPNISISLNGTGIITNTGAAANNSDLSAGSSSPNTGLIIGLAVGIALLLLVIGIGIWIIVARKKLQYSRKREGSFAAASVALQPPNTATDGLATSELFQHQQPQQVFYVPATTLPTHATTSERQHLNPSQTDYLRQHETIYRPMHQQRQMYHGRVQGNDVQIFVNPLEGKEKPSKLEKPPLISASEGTAANQKEAEAYFKSVDAKGLVDFETGVVNVGASRRPIPTPRGASLAYQEGDVPPPYLPQT
ncbi:hypothetical protein HDU97_005778 [Phlyctochytrium planicorne]|nr:hypothetical protein HDU97_005778 [Phlyctochytrium planicorne]